MMTRDTHATLSRTLVVAMTLALAACSALQAPPRPLVYDFGPGSPGQARPAPPPTAWPALVLTEVETTAALDSTAVLYRLVYSDAQQLRPYAQARWSMSPAQLVRQRLRETLGQQRVVLSQGDGVAPGAAAMTLRVGLEEFSQSFDAADRSHAQVRLRATLSQTGAGAERLVAQRSFVVQRASGTPDAAGGVQALAEAADAAIAEIGEWVQHSQVRAGGDAR